jgi:hypothetical protein
MSDIVLSILGIIILAGFIGLCLYSFLKAGKARQIEIILEWLLLAVIRAEKELGACTGQVKLRFVYDLFIDKFKVVSFFITFSQFSLLVDQALETMRTMISSNKQVEEYVNTK